MTDLRFDYDTQLLDECAQSGLAAFITGHGDENLSAEVRWDTSCCRLYDQHARHYYYGRSMMSPDCPYEAVVAGQEVTYYKTGKRLENFVRNVVGVYQHNYNHNAGESRHHVALNRFADMDLNTILGSGETVSGQRRLKELNQETAWVWSDMTLNHDFTQDFYQQLPSGLITPLSSSKLIMQVAANLAIGKGSFNKLNPKAPKKTYDNLPDTFINVPPMDDQQEFQTPTVSSPDLNGVLLSIKRNKHYHQHHGHAANDDDDDEDPDDDFTTHLNWATSANPDGVPIVNDAFDQGPCGSCWAFAAAGSLEASAARREAYLSYVDYMNEHLAANKNDTQQIEDVAVSIAQARELESFQMLNLSVQELLDCDTAADQGCTGGNPLLAFFFIHRYGLTSWDQYPYTGSQDRCRKELVRHPVASVTSWGIISPNHEKHMELVLRFVGPIAVGFNGAQHSFLTYNGGIFDKKKCKQGANHALLIVGYGQEEHLDGNVTKYWIARNSWGKGWGENGFVRIARRRGSKGVPGVCGIARSPSVALGGFLVDRQEGLPAGLRGAGGTVQQLDYTPMESICVFLGLPLNGSCGDFSDWVATHHALVVGAIGVLLALISIWPLSSDWRRRRRRRRLREEQRRKSAKQQDKENKPQETSPLIPPIDKGTEQNESSPLLSDQDKNNTYGASGTDEKD